LMWTAIRGRGYATRSHGSFSRRRNCNSYVTK
jgi:hypothetical protein